MSTVTEVKLVDRGRVKFFRADRGFGFIETSDCDYFFTAGGYREPVERRWGIVYVPKELPNGSIPDGTPIKILSHHKTKKGLAATEWTLLSLAKEIPDLYVGIQKVVVKKDPVVDNAKKMWVQETHVYERIAFIGNYHDCIESCIGTPGFRVVALTYLNAGVIPASDSATLIQGTIHEESGCI